MNAHPNSIPARRIRPRSHPRDRRGVLLVVVLLVIALLGLAGYSYSEFMFSEYRGARVGSRLVQARLAAESGVEAVKAFLMQDEATRQAAGGVYENAQFHMALVHEADGDRNRARYSVVAPVVEADGTRIGIRFGLENESARLNVNALLVADNYAPNGGRTLLMALPGMTEEVADAIMDYIDADEEPREFGCESETYATMTPPYQSRNGPLMSVEELLLVRGVTPALLFGADVNRNGVVDPSEAGRVGQADDSGSLEGGWSSYLTLFSQEKNVKPDGTPRINLNNSDLTALYDELTAASLPAEWTNFIIAYRQNGPYREGGGGGGSEAGGGADAAGVTAPTPDLTKPAQFQFSQVLDLVGKKVRVVDETSSDSGFGSGSSTIIIDSPFPDDPFLYGTYLTALMDTCTVNPAASIPGRININQAPRALLLGVPAIDLATQEPIMTEDIVEEIISRRVAEPAEDAPQRLHETWLLTEGIVTLDEMKGLMPYITASGSAYRAQVVGYFDRDGPAARLETVIDATTAVPRIVFWRDITHLGPGYAAETLGVESRE